MNNLPEHDIAPDRGVRVSFTRPQIASPLQIRVVGILLEPFQELVDRLFHWRLQRIPVVGKILVRDYINLFRHF